MGIWSSSCPILSAWRNFNKDPLYDIWRRLRFEAQHCSLSQYALMFAVQASISQKSTHGLAHPEPSLSAERLGLLPKISALRAFCSNSLWCSARYSVLREWPCLQGQTSTEPCWLARALRCIWSACGVESLLISQLACNPAAACSPATSQHLLRLASAAT